MKPTQTKTPITVSELKLFWSVRHWQCWSKDNGGPLGLSILVEAADRKTRSLIIEFPFEWKGKSLNLERKFKIAESEVGRQIEHAIHLGWDPDSRGKSFVLHVET